MGYTKFCGDYGGWTVANSLTKRIEHKAGQSCEVDWSGPTLGRGLVDPITGEVSKVYLFVGVLPFSQKAYFEPTLDMRERTWLRCHVHMYEFWGGVPERTVCDNLKTGVTKHPREGEIVLNVSATAKSAERATLSRRRRPRFPAGGATALWPPALPRAAAQGALDRGVVEVRGPDLNLQRRGALGVPGRDRPARDLPSAELREPDRHRDVLCAERGQPPRGVRGPHDCPLSGSPSPSAASASRSFMR